MVNKISQILGGGGGGWGGGGGGRFATGMHTLLVHGTRVPGENHRRQPLQTFRVRVGLKAETSLPPRPY